VVDLDSLKSSNDTHGHQVGDDMLLALASALSRDGAIVGRYGGDEFLVVLPDADRQAAERYGEMVRVELANLQLTDPDTGSRVPVMASLGLAICPDDAQSARDLIRIADQGMYASRATRDAAQSPNAA
jgi:diguanylate cyclase (GGDEF)-like protein